MAHMCFVYAAHIMQHCWVSSNACPFAMPARFTHAPMVYWAFGPCCWRLVPAKVPIIACNAGINKPTSPCQTATALLWNWIGILLG